MKQKITSYAEFWPYYLSQHSQPWTKRFHVIGLLFAITMIALAIRAGFGAWSFLLLFTTYIFAWFSHFVIEKNRPATFDYPVWSLFSEFRMVALLLLRKSFSSKNLVDDTDPPS